MAPVHTSKWKAFFAVLFHLIVLGNATGSWTTTCPSLCTCHTTQMKDLPMRRWLMEGATNNESKPFHAHHYNNEATYKEDAYVYQGYTDDHEPLKTATCVLQRGVQPETIFSDLAFNVQVLTFLQAPDSGSIILEASFFERFEDLIALEIQGFYHSSHVVHHHRPNSENEHMQDMYSGQIVLKNDASWKLPSLKYLHLQYITLQGDFSKLKPEYSVDMNHVTNDIFHYQHHSDYDNEENNNNQPNNLVFLTPDKQEVVVPYEVYKEEKDKIGLATFTGLSNLLFLRIYGCGLKEVHWAMFDSLSKLEYLSLEENDLLYVTDFAFYGTPNLKTLSLAHNKILNLQSTGLAGLLELEKLDLSHNNISHLSELSLPPFPKLKTTDFSHNPLETVFPSAFEIMNATEVLLMGSHDTPFQMQRNCFLGLSSLKKLVISNVSTDVLERELLDGMPELETLKLHGSVTVLSFDAFLSVPNLQSLVMSKCHIEKISMDAFYGLYGLIQLDLSNNLLEELPPGLFDQQQSLRELLLQNNNLKKLSPGIFINIPAKMIRLEGNPWHCTCAMKNWKPTIINKVKQSNKEFCQFQYDKGSMCSQQLVTRYAYEKRVAPRCATPVKYKDWSVFDVMRKELHCGKRDKKGKLHLKKKYEDYNNKKENLRFEKPTKDHHQDRSNLSENKNEEEKDPINEQALVRNYVNQEQIYIDGTGKSVNPVISIAKLNTETSNVSQGLDTSNVSTFLPEFGNTKATEESTDNTIISDNLLHKNESLTTKRVQEASLKHDSSFTQIHAAQKDSSTVIPVINPQSNSDSGTTIKQAITEQKNKHLESSEQFVTPYLSEENNGNSEIKTAYVTSQSNGMLHQTNSIPQHQRNKNPSKSIERISETTKLNNIQLNAILSTDHKKTVPIIDTTTPKTLPEDHAETTMQLNHADVHLMRQYETKRLKKLHANPTHKTDNSDGNQMDERKKNQSWQDDQGSQTARERESKNLKAAMKLQQKRRRQEKMKKMMKT